MIHFALMFGIRAFTKIKQNKKQNNKRTKTIKKK